VPTPIYGCTDDKALNYNASATVDDGSCTYPISGCTDPNSNDYNSLAVIDDGSCTYDDTWNCDTVNGGVTLITDGTGTYSDYAIAIADCPVCGTGTIPGCTDPLASNYDPTASCDDGSCIPCINGCIDGTINTGYGFPDIYGFCVGGVTPAPSTGLCDPNQGYVNVNYDPNATCDDGSCSLGTGGCTDPLADNYDASANYDDGSCYYCSNQCGCNHVGDNPDINGDCRDGTNVGYPNLGGCGTDNGYHAANYDPTAPGFCNHNCTPACIFGCTDPNATNYYPGASADDGSCLYAGCTDPTADNYDPLATIDDGSCTYGGGSSPGGGTGSS